MGRFASENDRGEFARFARPLPHTLWNSQHFQKECDPIYTMPARRRKRRNLLRRLRYHM